MQLHRFRFMAIAPVVYLAFLASCVTTEGSLFETVVDADAVAPADADANGDDDSEDDAGKPEPESGVRIETTPAGAEVSVNGMYEGKTPLDLDLESGVHRISISLDGYRTEYLRIVFEEGDYQSFAVTLSEITGYLYVAADPADSEITIDGTPGATGVTELRVGRHLVTVKAFGFRQYEERVTIGDGLTTVVTATLEPAPLELSALGVSRRVLNPDNPGKLGEVSGFFEATASGAGTVTIRDEKGEPVRSIELEPFATWSQQFVWDGAGDGGSVLPDGGYTIEVTAAGADEVIAATGPVDIIVSREAVITSRSGWSGTSGLLYVPIAGLLPPSSFQISTTAAGTVTSTAGRVPLQIAARFPLACRYEATVQGTIIINSEGGTPASVGVSVMRDLYGSDDATSAFALAAYATATWLARSNADTQTNFTGIRAGSVATLRGGPFRLSAAVDLHAAPYPASYAAYESPGPDFAPSIWSYGRMGILVDLPGFSAGLSAAIRTRPFHEGIGLQLPIAAGAELHWLIPGTFVVVSAVAFSEFVNTADYYVSYGGGIGIIH